VILVAYYAVTCALMESLQCNSLRLSNRYVVTLHIYIIGVVQVRLYLYSRRGDVKSSICGVRLPIWCM